MGKDYSENKIKIGVIACIGLFSPFLTSYAGIYYLGFFDSFVATIPLSLGAVIEYWLFMRVLSFDELQRETEKYTGEKAPQWIENLIKGKVVYGILLANLGLALFNQVHIKVT